MSTKYEGPPALNSSSVLTIEAPVLIDTQTSPPEGATERATPVNLAGYRHGLFDFAVLPGDSKTKDLQQIAARMGLERGFCWDSKRWMGVITTDRRRLVALCIAGAYCLAQMTLPHDVTTIAEEQFNRLSTLDKKLAKLVDTPVTQDELDFIQDAAGDVFLGWRQAALRQLCKAVHV